MSAWKHIKFNGLTWSLKVNLEFSSSLSFIGPLFAKRFANYSDNVKFTVRLLVILTYWFSSNVFDSIEDANKKHIFYSITDVHSVRHSLPLQLLQECLTTTSCIWSSCGHVVSIIRRPSKTFYGNSAAMHFFLLRCQRASRCNTFFVYQCICFVVY